MCFVLAEERKRVPNFVVFFVFSPALTVSRYSTGVESRLRKHLERKASLAAEGLLKADGGGSAGKGMWARLLAKTLDNLQVSSCEACQACEATNPFGSR